MNGFKDKSTQSGSGKAVMMEGSTDDSPTYCLIEEEYTIAVPLFRPKAAFLELLKQSGATHEVLTRKQILDHLKVYIVSKQLVDLYNQSIIHCEGDLLGEVFGVSQFTISEVPNLLTTNCIQLQDTNLQKRRRLVWKSTVDLNTISTSASTTEGVSDPQTSSPIVTNASLIKPVKNLHRAPCKRRKSSSSSSCEDEADVIENAYAELDPKSSGDKTNSIESENIINARSLDEIVNGTEIAVDKCSKNIDECEVSSENHECENASSSGESLGTKSAADVSTSNSNAYDFANEKGHSLNQTNVWTPEHMADSLGYRREQKNDRSLFEASSCKRHQAEPDTVPTTGESTRQPGTSLSIMNGDDCNKYGYPWYSQLEHGDRSDSEESEILSVQDKETVIVPDSTDDLWSLEEDSVSVEEPSDTEFSVEFDVESDNSPPSDSDLSSVRSAESFLVVCKESDVEFFADCSDSDSNFGDKELSEADNWVCTGCNQSNSPVQRYCGRCCKLRTDWLRSQAEADEKHTNHSTIHSASKEIAEVSKEKDKNVDKSDSEINEHVGDTFFKDLSEQRYSFSNIQLPPKNDKSTDDTDSSYLTVTKASSMAFEEPCIICLNRPKTASVIHGTSGHQICCFSCGKRLKKSGKLCPVCRRPIQKVIRNYIL